MEGGGKKDDFSDWFLLDDSHMADSIRRPDIFSGDFSPYQTTRHHPPLIDASSLHDHFNRLNLNLVSAAGGGAGRNGVPYQPSPSMLAGDIQRPNYGSGTTRNQNLDGHYDIYTHRNGFYPSSNNNNNIRRSNGGDAVNYHHYPYGRGGDAVDYHNPPYNGRGRDAVDYLHPLYGGAFDYPPQASPYRRTVGGDAHLLPDHAYPYSLSNNNGGIRSNNNNYSWNELSRVNNNPAICRPPPRPLRVHQPQQPMYTSVKELRGRILAVGREQCGCRFLQTKLEEGKEEDIEMIFEEIKDHVGELMVHQVGNYLIQKLLNVCDEEQISQLLYLVTHDALAFTAICTDTNGTRAVQRLLECLTKKEQRLRVVSAIQRTTLDLTKSVSGHHVIHYCLKTFSIEDNKQILNAVADRCYEIATDKSGCCVLQQCVEHARGDQRDRLISNITADAVALSENAYGNYVVQYIIGLKIPHVTANVMTQLRGSFVSLSLNKYGSNVVEKFLKESGENRMIVSTIVQELINSSNFLMLLQDPYGNFVAQTALAMIKGELHNKMVNKILANETNLKSHPHGKRVLARACGNH